LLECVFEGGPNEYLLDNDGIHDLSDGVDDDDDDMMIVIKKRRSRAEEHVETKGRDGREIIRFWLVTSLLSRGICFFLGAPYLNESTSYRLCRHCDSSLILRITMCA